MTSPLLCLALAIYFEARSEPVVGQFAVAEVIMNRVHSPRFPDDVCSVVKEHRGPNPRACQFSFYCDGKSLTPSEAVAWRHAQDVANDVLMVTTAPDVSGGALFYHANYVSPSWAESMEVTAVYGVHIFFTDEVIYAYNDS